jgi:hypothetical protein
MNSRSLPIALPLYIDRDSSALRIEIEKCEIFGVSMLLLGGLGDFVSWICQVE